MTDISHQTPNTHSFVTMNPYQYYHDVTAQTIELDQVDFFNNFTTCVEHECSCTDVVYGLEVDLNAIAKWKTTIMTILAKTKATTGLLHSSLEHLLVFVNKFFQKFERISSEEDEESSSDADILPKWEKYLNIILVVLEKIAAIVLMFL